MTQNCRVIRESLTELKFNTMLPTPDLGHLTAKDYQKVYEPAGMLSYFTVEIVDYKEDYCL